ncbi:alpha/beta hydrolase family protein [Ornithinimicrobium murale]|uniref:S9 family peptidase n=1 Tax=Ornithinimicrobium murale TaxID=1050153 RepID=UPI000E0CC0A3|nr:S9 family peptidase [Ornithinimicrobium murale]
MVDLSTSRLVSSLFEVRAWTAFDVDGQGRILAGHDELGSTQLVEIDSDGTRTPLTRLPGKCSGRYVPGRRQVVVQHDQGGDENLQLSLLDLPRSEPAGLDELTPLVRDTTAMHVLHDITGSALTYSTNRRNRVDMDVVRHDLADGTETVLYDGGGYVADVAPARDGRSVVVTRLSLQPASSALDLAGPENITAVTDPDEHALHHHVAWSADGTALVLSSNHDREFAAVRRLSLDGAEWADLVADEAHDLLCWASPDASALIVGTLADGALRLAVHNADGAHRHDLDLGATGMAEVVWSADSTQAVVTVTGPTEPGGIHLIDPADGATRRVVSSAEEMDPTTRDLLVQPTTHRVPTPDGEQIPCFVYPAAGAGDPALAGAAVLHVHGGPEAAANQIFHPVIQALAASGLTVLVPNVRGSSGYGKRWVSLDDGRLRLDSVADLAALHAWLPSQGLDPERAALWGGSYGGYMVLAGVAMQPDLWAAGVDIVGISSLVTFLENTSDYRRAYREREYGWLEHDREFLVEASPITYLDDITAPLFVIHGANDPRVPLSEAEQIKEALDGKGVPCELRVYHDEGHGLARRENKLDAYPAAIGFLHAHLTRG